MTTLFVRGLDAQGPDDVVGAFVNETDADPAEIGEIRIDGEEATVEVDEAVAEAVAATMDGGDVGGATVSVSALDPDDAAVREYVAERSRLVERERAAEIERHEREIERLSAREREAKGRALREMSGRDEGEEYGDSLVKFVRRGGEALPETDLSVGDLAMVSKRDPTRDDNPTGTVTQVTNHSVTVAFDHDPPEFVYDDGLRLDRYANDVTFQRMLDALDALPDATGALADLRDVIVGVEPPSPLDSDGVEIDEWGADLDDTQREAVRRALAAEDAALIHGPPGTGKTTTAVEVIRQAVERGESVLATAASNAAVDNLVEFLADRGVDAVRVGHPARVTPAIRERTLDARLDGNDAYERSREYRNQAFEMLDERDDLTPPSGKWRRGLSDERIRQLADEGRGDRGVPAETIEEMARWLDLDEQIDELFDLSDRIEDEAIAEVLDDADAVCVTNATAGSDALDGRTFDTLVIDEATQATEPSCLIPVTRARRTVLVGDHRQLPPTVRSEEAANEGLRETLFERLARRYPGIVTRLGTQYRMHDRIAAFPRRRFYDGDLRAADAVRDHTLADRGVDAAALPDAHREALAPSNPVTFVDTADLDAPERRREGSTSVENPREADLVAAYVRAYLDAGLAPSEVAVIAPYDDQTDRIRDALAARDADVDGVEVDTVDGFQGREKEAVVVSLVRSNDRGEVGFLDEPRRFNVSLTRARRKAVVVGDADTVTAADVYDAFVAFAREEATVVRPEPEAVDG